MCKRKYKMAHCIENDSSKTKHRRHSEYLSMVVIPTTGCVFRTRVEFQPNTPARLPQGLLSLSPNVKNLNHHNWHVGHHPHQDMTTAMVLLHYASRCATLKARVTGVASRLTGVFALFWPLYYK